MNTFTKSLLILLLPLMGVSHAALIYDESFESFDAGDVAGQGNWSFTDTGSTETTSHKINTTGGLSYSGGAVNHSGGSNFLRTTDKGEDWASVTFSSQNGDEIYLSFLAKNPGGWFHTLGLSDDVPTSATGLPMGGSTFNGTEARARIGSNVFGGSNDSGNVGDLEHNGNTVLYVGKLWKSTSGASETYDRFSYTINPTTLTEPASWNFTASTDTGLASADTILLRSGNNKVDFETDMLRVGTTYDAVVIPEPGTLALMGIFLGAAVMVTMKRRR